MSHRSSSSTCSHKINRLSNLHISLQTTMIQRVLSTQRTTIRGIGIPLLHVNRSLVSFKSAAFATVSKAPETAPKTPEVVINQISTNKDTLPGICYIFLLIFIYLLLHFSLYKILVSFEDVSRALYRIQTGIKRTVIVKYFFSKILILLCLPN